MRVASPEPEKVIVSRASSWMRVNKPKFKVMQIVKKIRLIDGSEHDSKQMAERHLSNMMSSGVCARVVNALTAERNAIKNQMYIVENESEIIQMMQVVRELNEVRNLKF